MYALRGRVVAITGGNRGIGLALAHAYGARGAKVAILARDRAELARAQQELEDARIEAASFRCDVTKEDECAAAIDGVRARFGAVDVLVSNAGVSLLSPVEELTRDVMLDVFAINVLGPLRLAQLVLPAMRARGDGQIVLVSSIAAMRALPGLGGYAATKAGLNAIADALRTELRGSGVDVITVCPGKTATDIVQSARGSGSGRRPLEKLQPTMQPADVAEAVVRASERRTSRVTLGVGAHLIELAQRVSPALCDQLASRAMEKKR